MREKGSDTRASFVRYGAVICLTSCLQYGFAAEIPAEKGAWNYRANKCTNFSNASTWAADCAVLDGGTWKGSGTGSSPFRCENASHPRPWSDESQIEPLASARAGGVASLQGWQSENSLVHCTGVFDTGSLTKTLGVESGNVALISIDGNAGAWGATRDREIKCPSGSRASGDRCVQHPVADPYRSFDKCTKNTTNPVNAFTGAKIHSETDFRDAGPNPIVFKRYYSTRTQWRFAPWEASGFGTFWRHNYMRSIEHFKNDTFEAVTVYLGNGNRNYFTAEIVDDAVMWTATEPDISSVLTSLIVDGVGYWDLRKPDGSLERYAKDTGKLEYAITRDGFRTTFEYDAQQRLSQIKNEFGRSLVFTYADAGVGAGLIESVALAVNNEIVPESVIRYDYENTNPSGYQVMLDKVIYPDDTPEDLTDNRFKDYLYNEPEHIYFDEQWIVNVEDGPSLSAANHPSKLTGIIDENGTRFATYKYQRVLFDGGYRFMLPVWGGHGAPDANNRYAREYKITRYQPTAARGDSRSHRGYASIKDALGTERQFHFRNYSGVLRPTEVVGGKCEICGTDSQKIEYDSSGFVNRRIDFAGNETIYQHNDLGLEVCRIEGISTTDSGKNAPRRITTKWHNELRVMLWRKTYEPTAAAELTTCNVDDDSGWTLRHEAIRHYEAGSARIMSESEQSYSESGVQDEPPRVTSYTYYGNNEQWGLPNQLKQVDGPRTDVVDTQTYRYAVSHSAAHSPGDLVEIENALGHVVRINKHDSFGRPIDITGPNGSNEQLTYYPRGWLKTRSIDGHETNYLYDGLGQLKKVTYPNGSSIMQDYDDAHRLTDIRDNLGNHVHYTLDPMGNRIAEEIRDPSGMLRKHSLRLMNSINQIEKQISPVDEFISNVTGFLYDINGLVHKVIDPRDPDIDSTSSLPNSAQVFSELTYDALNRITLRRNNEGYVTVFTYDIFDQLKTVTEPNDNNASTPQGLITRYSYNSYGDLKVLDSPDTGISKYDYDQAGNRTQVQRASDIAAGRVITYQYDALNRLHSVDYEGDTLDVIYLYDEQNDNQNGVGRLTSIYDESGETFLFYDKRGNTEKISNIRQGIRKDTSFGYNGNNQLLFMTTPGGKQINYFYRQSTHGGASSQLEKIELREGNGAEVLAHNINYLPFGPISGWTYGNDIVSSRAFDLSYRINHLRHVGVWDKTLLLDSADNILQISDRLESGRENNYFYDHLDRLTEAVFDDTTYRYNYDAVGNRRSIIEDAVQYDYSYKVDSHHLMDVDGPISYDINGNVTLGHRTQYEYGWDNRMKTATKYNGDSVSYQHNALGQRTSKSGNHKTIYYYDPQGRLIEEADNFGNTAKTYIYLGSHPLALIEQDIDPFDDYDEDGMLNGFEIHFGLDGNDLADAGYDFDGDGFSNLSEHDAGTDPTDLSSFPNTSNSSLKQVPALGKIAGIVAVICIMVAVLPHLNSASVVVALVIFCSWVISQAVSSEPHSGLPIAVSDSSSAFLR